MAPGGVAAGAEYDWPAMDDPYLPILDALSAAKRVLVTTHVRPDGDAEPGRGRRPDGP